LTADLVGSDGLAGTLRRQQRRAPRPRGPIVQFTTCGLELSADIEFDAWAALGARIARMTSACAWCLGDWLVFGERAYAQRYKTALEATSLDYQTLRNYAWVARTFALSRRRDTLSFQHHAEVAALPEPQQDLWLMRAERFQWSRNELRRQLRAMRRLEEGLDGGEAVVLRVPVTSDREQRWRRAAAARDERLADWLSCAADAAADSVLGPGQCL
jgi:hypothetical protein